MSMGLNPEYFQLYRNDRERGPYFNTSYYKPSVYGVVMEYNQYAEEGKETYASNPYFTVETHLRGCDSMVYRLPIWDTTDNANVGGIAGLAIRPIVSNLLPTPEPPTDEPPTEEPMTEQPTAKPTTKPATNSTMINWAVLVCGSRDYDNYRHHADM